ncbi:MAG: ATP-binding protein [Verrucomicrobiales bacterium]
MRGLAESKLLRSLSEAELEVLRPSVQERQYGPGEVIFKEGDSGDGIYLVHEGNVQVAAIVGHEKRTVLTRIGPGDFFGEMAVLDQEPRSATVIAEHETFVSFIPRQVILKLIESSPRLAISLVREFSLRLRDFNRHFVQEALQAERLTLVGKFARSIVHDFKNPLGIVSLAAELLTMPQATTQMREKAAERIQKQVIRLGNMINELLEFTREPNLAVVLAPTTFADYLAQLVDDIAPELEGKGVQICLHPPVPQAMLLMDPQRLMHVFYNLFHNAAEAMPQGGLIHIRCRNHGHSLLVEVEDTGSGFAPEIVHRLFEPFATHGKAKGTGLGLSICKKIIEDHRGTITASSEPGHGAIFQITFPAKFQNEPAVVTAIA